MANTPLLFARVNITAKDIFGNNVAKQYNNVISMNFDYAKGMLSIVNSDTNGLLYFSLTAISTLTYTIVTGVGGQHSVTMS